MSQISAISSLSTMFQTSDIVCQNIRLTDDLKIGLEYDSTCGLLNISVESIGQNSELPSNINILSKQSDRCDLLFNKNRYLYERSEIKQDFEYDTISPSYGENQEPIIYIQLTNIYEYDLDDANENESEDDPCQTMITSPFLYSSSLSSSASSCFDDRTVDNDDGYSTHSLDDTDHQQSFQQTVSIPSPKLIVPFISYQHNYEYFDEDLTTYMQRLIERMMWLSPFKKTVKQMMINRLFS